MRGHDQEKSYAPYLWQFWMCVLCLRAEGHFAVQEQQGYFEHCPEVKAEALSVHFLRVVTDRLVLGTNVLNEGKIRRHLMIRVGRDVACLNHEAQIRICFSS